MAELKALQALSEALLRKVKPRAWCDGILRLFMLGWESLPGRKPRRGLSCRLCPRPPKANGLCYQHRGHALRQRDQDIRSRWHAGRTLHEISLEYHVSKARVHQIAQEHEVQPEGAAARRRPRAPAG